MSNETKTKLPMTLLLTRKSFRTYPGGIVVGMYYSKDLKQNIAISAHNTEAINAVEEKTDDDNS